MEKCHKVLKSFEEHIPTNATNSDCESQVYESNINFTCIEYDFERSRSGILIRSLLPL